MRWTCSACAAELASAQPQHDACCAVTRWLCQLSGANGLHKNFKRHAARCAFCSSSRLREIAAREEAEKENRLSGTAETESSQIQPTFTT